MPSSSATSGREPGRPSTASPSTPAPPGPWVRGQNDASAVGQHRRPLPLAGPSAALQWCEVAAKRLEQEMLPLGVPERRAASEQTEMPLTGTDGK